MKTKVLLCAFLLAVNSTAHAAVVLMGWDFDPLAGGTNDFGPSPYAPVTTAANATYVGLTRGSGIGTTGSGASNGWGGNSMTETSFANALSGGDFVTFSITPDASYAVSLDSISAYNIRRSSTGPTTGQWQYQVGAGSFVDIGSAITWGATTTSAGNAQAAIDLSSITALQNVTDTITFRLVLWGASGAAGTWYFNDPPTASDDIDLALNGTIEAIPEPSRALLLGLGLGSFLVIRRRRQS